MSEALDPGIELLQRRARLRAATADPGRTTHPAIAAMMAGAGAELVARAEAARQVLEARIAARARRVAATLAADPSAGATGGSAPSLGQ